MIPKSQLVRKKGHLFKINPFYGESRFVPYKNDIFIFVEYDGVIGYKFFGLKKQNFYYLPLSDLDVL